MIVTLWIIPVCSLVSIKIIRYEWAVVDSQLLKVTSTPVNLECISLHCACSPHVCLGFHANIEITSRLKPRS